MKQTPLKYHRVLWYGKEYNLLMLYRNTAKLKVYVNFSFREESCINILSDNTGGPGDWDKSYTYISTCSVSEKSLVALWLVIWSEHWGLDSIILSV